MARILFCTWQYHPVPAGGAERQARLQAEELVRRGHEVTVFCPRSPGAVSDTVGGVRVQRLWRLSSGRVRYVGAASYFLSLWWQVVRRGRNFDLVHVHLANLQADFVVSAARLVGLPTHLKVANSGVHGETRRLERLARFTRWYGLRHADSVQALSEETRAELLRIGVGGTKIVAIPNGVPAVGALPERDEAREALGLPADERLVLFLGRFARYKGLADLLAAWEVVQSSGWRLLLVGEEAVDQPFGPLPDLPGLLVHPWTTEPLTYLAAADVFVLPSHSEGMSNALLEAMATGCCVVTSDTGAALEMVEHERSGLVHSTGDVDDLSRCLKRVMADGDLRASLAGNARNRSVEFSVGSVVDRLEAVYERIVRTRS